MERKYVVEVKELGPIKYFKGELGYVNVFVGVNMSGKSLLIKTILSLISQDERYAPKGLDKGIANLYIDDELVCSLEYIGNEPSLKIEKGIVYKFRPYFIPDYRLAIKYIEALSSKICENINRIENESIKYNISRAIFDLYKILDDFIESKLKFIPSYYTDYKNLWHKIIHEKSIQRLVKRGYINKDLLERECIIDIIKEEKGEEGEYICPHYKILIIDQLFNKVISGTTPDLISGGLSFYFLLELVMRIFAQLDNIVLGIEEIENQAHPLLQILLGLYIYKLVKKVLSRKKVILLITSHSRLFADTISYIDKEKIVKVYGSKYDPESKGFIYEEIGREEVIPGFFDSLVLLDEIFKEYE